MTSQSDNTRGALLMMGCMVAFTVNDAFMKLVMVDLPMFQALFLRGMGTTLCMIAIGWAMGGLRMPERRLDRQLIALRTGAEVIAAFLFLTALAHMQIANLSAILQVLPLCVTLASALVFREPLGWRRLSAILVGFVGVLLIVRPGTDGFTIYSVYAIGSVAAVVVRDLAVRRLSRDVASITAALMTAAGVTLAAGLASAFVDWAPVDGRTLSFLACSTVFVVAGYLMSVMAMRVGEIGVVAPFRYTSLIAALLLGLLVFGDFPGTLTLIGAAIVVATGVFTLLREHRIGRARTTVPRPPGGTA